MLKAGFSLALTGAGIAFSQGAHRWEAVVFYLAAIIVALPLLRERRRRVFYAQKSRRLRGVGEPMTRLLDRERRRLEALGEYEETEKRR